MLWVSVVTNLSILGLLAPPDGGRALAQTSDPDRVTAYLVTWSDDAEGEPGYEVERWRGNERWVFQPTAPGCLQDPQGTAPVEGAAWSPVATLPANATSFTDTDFPVANDIPGCSRTAYGGAQPDYTQYVYRVRAFHDEPLGGRVYSGYRVLWGESSLGDGTGMNVTALYVDVFRNGSNHCPGHAVGQGFTPAQIGSVGGNMMSLWTARGYPIHNELWDGRLAQMRAARDTAGDADVPLRFFVSARPDLHGVPPPGFVDLWMPGETGHDPADPLQQVPVAGFDEGWLFASPRATVEAQLGAFASIVPKSVSSCELLWKPLWGTDLFDPGWVASQCSGAQSGPGSPLFSGLAPHMYASVSGTTLNVGQVQPDLNAAAYRAWDIDQTLDTVEYLGADGVFLGMKTGWHAWFGGTSPEQDPAYPCPSYTAGSIPGSTIGGPVSCTPYGPGEFETGMGAWIQELRAAARARFGRELAILVNEAPDGEHDKFLAGSWYPAAVREELAGESRSLTLPCDIVVHGP